MIPFIPNPADKSGGSRRDNHHFQRMIAQKERTAPQHTRSFCRRFTPTKSFACTAWAVFFFSGNAPWKFHEPSERDTGFPANAAAKQGQELRSGQPAILYTSSDPLLIFAS
jgi:hypothetical protein